MRNTGALRSTTATTPDAGESKPPVERPIYAIQGTRGTSPFIGQRVISSGVVTTTVRNGFFMQHPTGDGKPTTSDAIFVYTREAPSVVPGDRVRVEGTVTEFKSGNAPNDLTLTQLAGEATIEVVSRGNPLPAPVVLGREGRKQPTEKIVQGIDFYESLEGMRVQVNNAVAVGPAAHDTFVVLADDGVDATGRTERGSIRASATDLNPERVMVDIGALPATHGAKKVNVGDHVTSLVGVMTYSRGDFKLLPTEAFRMRKGTLAPETTKLVGTATQMTLASFNVENLDPKIESRELVSGPSDIDDDIGSGKLARLAQQYVTNLAAPDVVALQEMQDNDGAERTAVVDASATGKAFVEAVAHAGGPKLAYVDLPPVYGADGGQPGGNIRVAFAYRPDRISLVEGSVQRLFENEEAFTRSRKPTAARFKFGTQEVLVINVHFSSKSGSTPDYGTVQPPTNGSVTKRTQQAELVRDYVAAYRADHPDANVVVLGDMNEMEYNAPVQTLAKGGLVNLAEHYRAGDRYSYIFRGNATQIDQLFVSPNLAGKAELDVVHVNADFADQASDHDPVLARLTFAPKKP